MPFRRRALAFALLLSSLAWFTTAAAPAATDVTLDSISSASPIEVRGQAMPAGGGDDTPQTLDAGISFENRAGAPATSVDFTWLFIDANGNAIGQEHTSTRGRFAPNIPVANNAGTRVRFSGYSSGEELYVADDDTNLYDPVEHILVAVDNATFADGSTWHGASRFPNALPPDGASDATAAAAHIRILRIASTQAKSTYDHVDTRLSFANDGNKRIDSIEFEYTFDDLGGNVIQQQTAVARGAYPKGAVSTLNPSTRITYRGVVKSGGSVWVGWGPQADYVSKIVTSVTAVRYADGTTWEQNA